MRVQIDRLESRRIFPMGTIALFIGFIMMLSGRFSLGRLSVGLDFLDIRWVIFAAGLLIASLWIAAEKPIPHQKFLTSGTLFFIIWVLWMILTIGWAPSGVAIAVEAENFILLGLSILLISLIVRRNSSTEIHLLWWFVLLAAVMYFGGAISQGPTEFGRYSAFGGGPNVFVRVMVLGSIASLALSVGKGRWWVILISPVFALGAVLSGSRGGVLSAIVIIIVAGVPILRRLGWKKGILLAIPSAIIVVSTPVLLGAQEVATMYQRYIVGPIIEGDASSRDVLAERALGLFAENPIFGAGLGAVANASPTGERGLHAHNLILSTVAEGGIVGLVFLLASLGCFLLTFYKLRPLTNDALFSIVAAIYVLGATFFSGDYYDSRFVWFFLLIASSLAYRRQRSKLPQVKS